MSDDQKDKERLKKALDAMIFLPHLKDRQAQSVLAALIPDDKAPRATGRPWDRGDLFRRLKTFKSSTWFAKPNCICAEECARRGWQP
jgi:C3HC zinc finger-like